MGLVLGFSPHESPDSLSQKWVEQVLLPLCRPKPGERERTLHHGETPSPGRMDPCSLRGDTPEERGYQQQRGRQPPGPSGQTGQEGRVRYSQQKCILVADECIWKEVGTETRRKARMPPGGGSYPVRAALDTIMKSAEVAQMLGHQ